jgi:DNA invertase Pin-like site-specific DNA recombinase
MNARVQKIEVKKPLIPKRKRVCAYARVSSGKDAMLHSLSAQISYYSEYIQRNPEWEYVGVYADEALTGTKDNRAEFNRMIDDCKNGKIEIILTKSISRFARNTITLLSTVRELKSLGIDVWFEKENIHSISGDGELMLTILASFAQEESLSVSENCKWRIRHNYEEGIPNVFTIYGYNVHKRQLTVNEEQAKVVREIFELYAEGNGTYTIEKILNEREIPGPGGGKWHQRTIIDLLKNEKYIGDLLLQKYYSKDHISKRSLKNDGCLKQYYITENHEPIVDKALFDRVQNLIAEKNERNPYIGAYDYRFKDMVFCGTCGAKYGRKKTHTGTPSEHFIWICKTYTHKGKKYCSNKQIPDDVLCNMADGFDKEIEKVFIHEGGRVRFVFADGSTAERTWEIDRKWNDEMKQRNYINQRKRYL